MALGTTIALIKALGNATDEQVSAAADAWLEDNVAQETGYVLDSSLTMSNAAAPADKVGDLKSAFLRTEHPADNIVAELVYTQGGYYRTSDNAFVSNADWGYTELIPCIGGEKYYLNVPVVQYVNFYDESKSFISGLNGTNATAPSTAKYIRLSIHKNRQETCRLTIDGEYTNYVKNNSDSLHEMRSLSEKVEIHFEDGGLQFVNYTTGATGANNTYHHTDYVNVAEYKSLFYKRTGTTSSSSTVGIAFYDASKQYVYGVQQALSQESTGYQANLYKVSVPHDAVYARFTTYTDTTTYGEFALYGTISIVQDAVNSASEQRNNIPVENWETKTVIRYTNGNTSAASEDAFIASDYVDISKYNRIEFSCMARIGASTSAAVAFYDSSKNYVGCRKYDNYSENIAVYMISDIPETASYARFTYRKDYEPFYCYGRKDAKENPNHIRFLVFGNSYGCDSISYVPFILKNMGITSDIYLYVRDACSIRDLYNRWESDAASDTETDGIHAGTYQRFLAHIDTRYMQAWERPNRISMKDALELGNWDFVTIQQYSGYTMDIDNYAPWTGLVMELINNSLVRGTPLVYTHVWTRHAYDDPAASISTFEEVANDYPFDWCIPCGTAIFNARANTTIAQLGASQYHNLWCDDDIHLQDGLPCYIAAGAVVESICRHFFPERSFFGDKTEISQDWSIPEFNGPIIGMTDENILLAQKTVIDACNHPFEIIPATFTPKETYTSLSAFPAAGTKGILYVATDTGKSYTWDGSAYVENVAT